MWVERWSDNMWMKMIGDSHDMDVPVFVTPLADKEGWFVFGIGDPEAECPTGTGKPRLSGS